MQDQAAFFKSLGARIKQYRTARGFTQEDMISYGFSARHWQRIEHGRPITLTTLLRVAGILQCTPDGLLRGLDKRTGTRKLPRARQRDHDRTITATIGKLQQIIQDLQKVAAPDHPPAGA